MKLEQSKNISQELVVLGADWEATAATNATDVCDSESLYVENGG